MSQGILIRRGTASTWETGNPILAHGEQGYEISGSGADFKARLKLGDGVTPWSDLPYQGGEGFDPDSDAAQEFYSDLRQEAYQAANSAADYARGAALGDAQLDQRIKASFTLDVLPAGAQIGDPVKAGNLVGILMDMTTRVAITLPEPTTVPAAAATVLAQGAAVYWTVSSRLAGPAGDFQCGTVVSAKSNGQTDVSIRVGAATDMTAVNAAIDTKSTSDRAYAENQATAAAAGVLANTAGVALAAASGGVITDNPRQIRSTANTANGNLINVREFETAGNTLSAASDNTALFAAAVAGVPNGMTVLLPCGTWPGDISINRNFTWFQGSGKPVYNPLNGQLVGGTILKGAITAYVIGARIGHLGIDQTGTTKTDGIVSGSGTEDYYNDNHFHDIAILGRGFANGSTHGILTQGGGRARYDRISVYKFGHGQVLRCRDGIITNGYVEDAELSSYIVKSSGVTSPFNNASGTVRDCVARATTAGKFANLVIQGESADYMTKGVTVDGFWSYGSAAPSIRTMGTPGMLRDVIIMNAHVFGNTSARGMAFEGGLNVNVIGCHVYDGPQYSYGGDGAMNLNIVACSSLQPTAGHYIGAFSALMLNGRLKLAAEVATDDPPLVIPKATALSNNKGGPALSVSGTDLVFTVDGNRYNISMTARP